MFDVAIAGRWIYYDYLLAQKYIPTMTNLKYVLLPISYLSLTHSYHYNRWTIGAQECVYYYSKSMHLYYDRFPQSILFSSALFNGMIVKRKFINADSLPDSLGYRVLNGQQSNWKKNHNISSKAIEGDLAPYMEETQFYLEGIARNCFENNVALILVIPPFHDVYLQNTRQYGWDSIYSIVNKVQQKYPIRLYDYHNDMEFRDDSIWYNCSHLNDIGATLLAKRIRQDAGLP